MVPPKLQGRPNVADRVVAVLGTSRPPVLQGQDEGQRRPVQSMMRRGGELCYELCCEIANTNGCCEH